MRARRTPEIGTVVRIQVEEEKWAYLCKINQGLSWLYNFSTDYPVSDCAFFSPEKWLKPVKIIRHLPDFIDACWLDLPDDKRQIVPLWWTYSSGIMPSDALPGQDCVVDYFGSRYAKRSEIQGMHQKQVVDMEEAREWLVQQLPELRHLHIPIEQRDPKLMKKKARPTAPTVDKGDLVMEIAFPGSVSAQRDDLQEALEEAVEEKECGEWSGGGAFDGGAGGFDIVFDINRRRLKTALRVVRQVLKKHHAPAETKITVTDPDDPNTGVVEYPLEP